MSPGKLNKRVIGDRLAWLDKMVAEIRALPLESYEEFSSTPKNVWAAESCLRRALESIFDLGRHILAKGWVTSLRSEMLSWNGSRATLIKLTKLCEQSTALPFQRSVSINPTNPADSANSISLAPQALHFS